MVSHTENATRVCADNKKRLIESLDHANEASYNLQKKYASEPPKSVRSNNSAMKILVAKKIHEVKGVINQEATNVAIALWEYQFLVDGENKLWLGQKIVPGLLDIDLIERAQTFLHDWRLLLTAGEVIHSPGSIIEFECDDESGGVVRLYRSRIIKLAHEGESVTLCGSTTEGEDYIVKANEKAIFVHHVGYPSDQDRWVLIKKGDSTANLILPEYANISVVTIVSKLIQSSGTHSIEEVTTLSELSPDVTKAVSRKRLVLDTQSPAPTRLSTRIGAKRCRENGKQSNEIITGPVDPIKCVSMNHESKSISTNLMGKNSAERPGKGCAAESKESKNILAWAEMTDVDAYQPAALTNSNFPTPGAKNNDATSVDWTGNLKRGSEEESMVHTQRKREGSAKSKEGGMFGTLQKRSRNRSATTKKSNIVKNAEKLESRPTVKDDDMLWICNECREAECLEDPDAILMICEGKCNRTFHNTCCGVKSNVVSSEETWVCSDCSNKKHRCAVCQEYGKDDNEVFLCEKKGCGMFFHESCLRMQNVDIRLVEMSDACGEAKEVLSTIDDDSSVAFRPIFTCPAHSCWTCTEDFIPDDDKADCTTKSTKIRMKGMKKAKPNANFLSKRDRLYRCMECPIAYHVTCIPPTCRFHELALLCHEHSTSHKLPDLDMASSLQCQVEAEVDRKLEKLLHTKRANATKVRGSSHKSEIGENLFFPGLRGDRVTAQEETLLNVLYAEAIPGTIHEGLQFCLPCDFKEEVYSKPPSYKHVHSLRYNPSTKPKRKPPTGESCECHSNGCSICDDNCLNRMVMMECVGEKDKGNGDKNLYWNCNVGPSCGNRQMSQRAFAKCKPKREQGKGWGLVSINGIKKGLLVQEYVGEVIDEITKETRLVEWSRDHPNDPNFYIMQLESGWYIDARLEANMSRFINHSCSPNCHLLQINVNGYSRVGVFALSDIAPGEFLCYDYQFDTKDGDKFVCRCGAATCRGTMKGGKYRTLDGSVKTTKDIWKEAKAKYDRDVKFLDEVEKVEAANFSQVDAMVPGAEFSHEIVATGLSKRQDADIRVGLFLWRNTIIGSDFASRSRRKCKGKSFPVKSLSKIDVLSVIMNGSSFKVQSD